MLTPAALASDVIRREWRLARQEGVCVLPVLGAPEMDLGSQPRWVRDKQVMDLRIPEQWTLFLRTLEGPCETPRVPFMVEDLPPDFVARPRQQEAVLRLLLDEQAEPRAVTAVLRGAGGYGKTTLARAICHDPRIQEGFEDGILWVTLGENPGDLTAKVEDLLYVLSGERPGFSGLEPAISQLIQRLDDRKLLLVLDDVWEESHLRPFTQGGRRCARLITTRLQVPLGGASAVDVDAMLRSEAVELLRWQLPEREGEAFLGLASRLGKWPLLLKLVNGVLRERVNERRQSLAGALDFVRRALDRRGLVAFDAVETTLSVSFEHLELDELARYGELAVFPDDIDIPLATIERLWRDTGGLDDVATEELCSKLARLSLVLRLDLATGTLHLHDIIRAYLTAKKARDLPAIHDRLLAAHRPAGEGWRALPDGEPYLWDYVAYHLAGAGRGEELIATVKDLRFIAAKTHLRSGTAVEADLSLAIAQAPADSELCALRRSFAQSAHILIRCSRREDLMATLHSRLAAEEELAPLVRNLEDSLSPPFFTAWHPLPDLPDPALVRTLDRHLSLASGCRITPDGKTLLSSSWDKTLKVWDVPTGIERCTLSGHVAEVFDCDLTPDGRLALSASWDHTLAVWDVASGAALRTLRGHLDRVNGCAFSPDGQRAVSASSDGTLKVWDLTNGAEILTLSGHENEVWDCAFSPDGSRILSASEEELKVWDANTGQPIRTLRGPTGRVWGCAFSPDGRWIASASSDATLRIWDADTGAERQVLTAHDKAVRACTFSADGTLLFSASADRTVKIWDAASGAERRTLTGHSIWVHQCTVDESGTLLVSASADKTLKIWNLRQGGKRKSPGGHAGPVNGCAVSADGRIVVTASDDETLKIWDPVTGRETATLTGHEDLITGCAISPDGTWVVSAAADEALGLWNLETGERRWLTGHEGPVYQCSISPDGRLLASASTDRTIRIWDLMDGAEPRVLAGHSGNVYDCVFSPDGHSLLSASGDRTLRLWDVASGTERLRMPGHDRWIYGCDFSPDGKLAVTASDDRTLKIWDLESGLERLTLLGHSRPVRGCAFSPSGRWIASASYDQQVKLWDARSGSCLATLVVDLPLSACAWFPDEQHLLAVGRSGVYFLRLYIPGD